jgi:hypothetical protein
MAAAMKTSSQSHLRNVTRKCKTEGCERAVAEGRGLCHRCYSIVARIEKSKAKSKSARIPGVHEDKEVVLPVRKNFEWLGDLQSSVRAMQCEEN